MLTLLSECHFWTLSNEINIKDTDFGAFKYTTNKDFSATKTITSLSKKDYVEKRDGIVIIKNHHTKRLKENLKKLEEHLKLHKIIHSDWHDARSIRVLLSNGLLIYLCINIYTGDLYKIAYDKYFMGKLASEVITNAVFTRQHILLAYNTNQITMVYLQKPNMKKYGPEKITNMDPKIFHVLIPGQSERKLQRNIIVNDSFDLIIVWTKSSQSEIYPWRPTIRDQDRANIHVYKLRTLKLELIAYCWTENDPITVEFLRASEGCLLTLEQKISRKGEITAEICSYEIEQGKMKRSFVTSISIGTQICCHSFSPDQEKLVLGTIDRHVCIHDLPRRQTKFTSRADIIPTHCAWHPDSGLIIIANNRAQFQCFDASLSFIANQLISEDVTPSNLLDLSHYFTIQPNLLNILFSSKPYINTFSAENTFAQTDCFLFLNFENGPVGCLRFFASSGIYGDVHNSGLTSDVIIGKYLILNQFEKAVNLLLTLNWETYGAMCLISLHQITNYVFRKNDIKTNRNELLTKALLSFHDELSEETKDEFEDQVIDLKRRFFFFLLRHNLFYEAFDIAENIEDYDLFMDIFNFTKTNLNFIELSQKSYAQAESIINKPESAISGGQNSKFVDTNSFSSCSHSSCSGRNSISCDGHTTKSLNPQYFDQIKGKKQKNYIPPLPYFKSPILNNENLKINIPKPELRINPLDMSRNGFRSISEFKSPPDTNQKSYKELNLHHHKNLHVTKSEFSYLDKNKFSKKKSNDSSVKPKILDQTIGIPITVPTLKFLPRATNTINTSENNSSLIFSRPSSSNQNENTLNLTKYYQHPLISGKIPPTINTQFDYMTEDGFKHLKKPAVSILANSSTNNVNNFTVNNTSGSTGINNNKKDRDGEKNKVKFSDTVQVAVVPEIPRKEKPLPPKRNSFRPLLLTNPERELADSLPLCHPHDEYLKDFNPISESTLHVLDEVSPKPEEETATKNTSTIKVVHFGVV